MKLFAMALVVAGIAIFVVSDLDNADGIEPTKQPLCEVPRNTSQGIFNGEDLDELRETGIQLGQDFSSAGSSPVVLISLNMKGVICRKKRQ